MKPNLAEPDPPVSSNAAWIDAEACDPTRQSKALTISQMAEKFAVTPRALRFYESRGLLAPARQGRARAYRQGDQEHLALILKGRKLGFTISEISHMIAAESGEASPQALKMTREKCQEQIEMLERQSQETREALVELRRMHTSLSCA
jgi:DNA-binding transcriptional MerR regulator